MRHICSSAHDVAKPLSLIRWAEHFRDELAAHADQLARTHALTIEFFRCKTFRKEDRTRSVVAERGDRPSLVRDLTRKRLPNVRPAEQQEYLAALGAVSSQKKNRGNLPDQVPELLADRRSGRQ